MKYPGSSLPFTCLLFESHGWHEEVFPQWVQWLNQLGYYVIIQVRKSVVERNATCFVEGEFSYRIWEPGTPPDPAGVDLLVINTLSGFMQPVVQAVPVEQFASFSVPSICYIHEPNFWMEKFPVKRLQVDGAGKGYTYELLRDGTFICNNGPISTDKWKLDEDKLEVPVEGNGMRFFRSNGHWKAEEEEWKAKFLPEPLPLGDYLARGKRKAFVCTAHSKTLMQPYYPEIDFLMPMHFGEVPEFSARKNFCIAGEIDCNRKDFDSLIAAEPVLKSMAEHVKILGGNRLQADRNEDHDEFRIRRNIRERGLEDKIRFTGFLPYRDFFVEMAQSRFILPLVDRMRDGGTYFTKLTGTVAYSLALGVPMVLDEELAELYDLNFMPTYRKRDLASGIARALEIGPEEYEAMVAQIRERRNRIQLENFERLKSFVEQVHPEHSIH